jgi:hypothetical protein
VPAQQGAKLLLASYPTMLIIPDPWIQWTLVQVGFAGRQPEHDLEMLAARCGGKNVERFRLGGAVSCRS